MIENDTNIKCIKTPYKDSVDRLLAQVKDNGYDSVIIFGFKDGCIYTAASKTKGRLETIGALEAAKQVIWNELEEDNQEEK